MKTVATLAASSLLASIVHGQVVSWDIERRNNVKPLRRRGVGKRANAVTETISNDETQGGYFAKVSIGTPAQSLTLQLDTGSSDIWVPDSNADICTQDSSDFGPQSGDGSTSGCALGSFDPSNSSSFSETTEEFQIEYVDGSFAQGSYFTDDFTIGGSKISNMTMGLGNKTDIAYGLVGVSYRADEASVSTDGSLQSEYPNLPVAMQSAGLINTVAYSLWLNDLDASSGQILFGGIDTGKYEGQLSRINIQKESGVFADFLVYMTSLAAVSSSGNDTLTSSDYAIGVVLDSGTTLSYLPTDLAEAVWQEVEAEYYASVGAAVIPCSSGSSSGTFEFGFGAQDGPKISVPMNELVLPLSSSGSGPKFSSGTHKGEEACYFGIQNSSSTDTPYLLGDTFMRSAYVVYDLVNNQIGLAKTIFNSTTTNVVAFASSGAQIPSATAVANQVTAAANGTASSGTGAESGFGVGNAAFTLPVFEWSQVGVLGASILFMLVGSGFFML